MPKGKSKALKNGLFGFLVLYPEKMFLDVITRMLSEKGLIGVEDKIHILNIRNDETLKIYFANVEEKTQGLELIGVPPSSAGLIGWLALDPMLS